MGFLTSDFKLNYHFYTSFPHHVSQSNASDLSRYVLLYKKYLLFPSNLLPNGVINNFLKYRLCLKVVVAQEVVHSLYRYEVTL